MSQPWVGLADAVKAIRAELQQASLDGQGELLKFDTGPVELEFTVDVTMDAKGKTKISVLPWSVQLEAGVASNHTQRLKVTLQPTREDGSRARISGHSTGRPT